MKTIQFDLHMKKLEWTTEKRVVRDLIPLDYNPRIRNEKKQKKLTNSISKFNLVEIPVINTDNHIIAGQRRWEAFFESGRENEYIDVRVPNRALSEDEVKEYNLISNTHAGEWSLPLLEAHFSSLYKDIVDLPSISTDLMSSEMIDKKETQIEVVEDEFTDTPPAISITQEGDLYQLNNHRLICGDSTDLHVINKLMDKSLADMVFTDPPYNVKIKDIVGLGKAKHDEFVQASGEMNRTRFSRFLQDCFLNLIKKSKNGSIHFICMDWKHVKEIVLAGEIYTEQKNLIIWKKDNGGMGSFYRSQHELIFVYKNGKKKHVNNFELGQHGRYRTNIWEYAGMNSVGNKERENLEDHPTVKPVKLVADAILDCSNLHNIILDIFLGYGTTIIAAEQTNRICYGSELDPKYCDLIVRRYIRYMRSNQLHVSILKNGVELTPEELQKYMQ
ncbi:site-specific DNA-methyltransferase [Porphyromonadaceae bacterium]